MSAQYTVRRTAHLPQLPSAWDGAFWSQADTLAVTHFHPQSASTHPRTQARVLYDSVGLYLHFRVADRYVRATYTEYQSPVCQDSCAEFFVEPVAGKGYFNFEINPLGTMLLFYVTDPTRGEGGRLAAFEPVPKEMAQAVQIHSSLRQPTAGEIGVDTEWWVQYAIPFTLFQPYLGIVRPAAGTKWRANFFKCGDQTSHPHWAAWSPIGAPLNFHAPEYFGELIFA